MEVTGGELCWCVVECLGQVSRDAKQQVICVNLFEVWEEVKWRSTLSACLSSEFQTSSES
jgi:hypothetical protein